MVDSTDDERKSVDENKADQIDRPGDEDASVASNAASPEVSSDQAVVGSSGSNSVRKWHDRKWILVSVTAVVGVIIGVGMAAPDRDAAKREASAVVADANKDAKKIKQDAKAAVKSERDKILSDAKKENSALLKEIEVNEKRLSDAKKSIRKARSDLSKVEKTRAKKQKEVAKLNRAVRASTSLSKQNTVAKARDYLQLLIFFVPRAY